MDLDSFADETKEITVTFPNGQVLPVRYRPNAGRLRDMMEGAQTPERAAEILCRVVASWDLTRGGAPVPLTQDALLDDVPARLLRRVQDAIAEDMGVGEESASTSSGT